MIKCPCHECPNRKTCTEYDEQYLQPVMASGFSRNEPDTPAELPAKKKAKPAKKSKPKPAPKKQPPKKPKKQTAVKPVKQKGPGRPKFTGKREPCKIGGCDRGAVTNGCCNACNSMVVYYSKRGLTPPDKLTQRQINKRRGVCHE